jgi:PAS domain S-box-containing protein
LSWIEQVFGSNPAVKLLLDPDTGRIVDANEAAALFYGWSIAELLEKRIQDINTLTDAEIRAEMQRASAGRRFFFRFSHRLASGEVRRVEVYTGPVTVEGQSRLLSIIHDVTERERALEELQRVEARQGALLEQMPFGVALHRHRRFFWVNEEWARIVGRRPEELIGVDPLETVPLDSREAVQSRIDAIFTGGGSTPLIRQELLRSDGKLVATHLRALPFQADGEPCVLVLAIDVSDREQLEEQLRRAQRMDAVGRLAGGVAHDFNNLLSVILGSTDVLERRTRDPDAVLDNVSRIRAAAERAAELTRQLLVLGRGHEARRERIDVANVIRQLLGLLKTTLGDAIEVRTDLPAGAFVVLPSTSLDQVMLNLIVNAKDAMMAGGTLSISVGSLAVDPLSPSAQLGLSQGPYVSIEVRDTGCGMTKEVLRSAFEPFFTTKEPGRGTGLGLATAYGIVRRAGGALQLESQPGRGTTARVLLPRADEDSPVDSVRSPGPPSGARATLGEGRTILLVDDHRQVREIVQQLLVEAGHRVIAASGPEEALTLAEEHASALELLITDVVMPKMHGPELARRIRATCPTLPVLFISGWAGDSLRSAGIDRESVLEKPFSAEALLARVTDLAVRTPREAASTKDP